MSWSAGQLVMPELGEVDLLASRLNARLKALAAAPVLISAETTHARMEQQWRVCAPELLGASLSGIARKGKYLIFHWREHGLMLAHLRMTGWWAWQQAPQTLTVAQGYTLDRHPKLFLTLELPDGSEERLIFYDSRMLGEVAYFPDQDWRKIPQLATQAPDFIGTENSVAGGFFEQESEFFTLVRAQQSRKTRRAIRDLLLDQSRQGLGAGLGNYLIAEVLYRAGVHPDRAFHTLSDDELSSIYRITRELFQHVITNEAEAAATMIIYQREKCPRGHQIQRDIRGNRGSYHCPQCQK